MRRKCTHQDKGRCLECQRAYMKVWRAKNREKIRAYHNEYYHKWKYGVAREDIPATCQVCDTRGTNSRNEIVVDHCHDTGRVRGFLCHNCNVAIGFVSDPNLLRKLADYLEKS